MAGWILIAVLACVALVPDVSGEGEVLIDLQITQRFSLPGENVTLYCDISNIQGSQVGVFSKKAGSVVEHMSVNEDLIEEYKASDRFFFTPTTLADAKIFNLNIINVRYEDTGLYLCSVVNAIDQGSVTFEVYRNTEDLAIYVNETRANEGELIDAEEGEPLNITCQASKAVPKPRVVINSYNRDVTEKFAEHEKLVIACENDPNCLLHMYYDVNLHSMGYKPRWEENGKTMTCKSIIDERDEIHKHHFEHKETSVRLNVTHSPVANCSSITAKLGASTTLRCDVFSNPPLASGNIKVVSPNGVNLKPGDISQDVSFKFTESSEYDQPGKMEVTWSGIRNQHFGTYRVEASNAIGERNSEFALKEDTPGGGGGGSGASTAQISLFSLFLVFAMAFSSH